MVSENVTGIIATNNVMIPSEVIIRAEKTIRDGKDFITVSLADYERGIMITVNYKDIKDLVESLPSGRRPFIKL